MAELKLDLVVRLLDRATAPVRRLGNVVQGLQRPFRAARMAAGDLGRDIARIGVAGAAMAVAAGAAVWSLTRRVADAGDAALEASERVGIGVVAFQRWSYAAKMSGSDATALETALKMLALSQAAAADGSKSDVAAFDALGLSVTDAEGRFRSLESMLPDIAEAFSKLEEGQRKTQIAMALFGRSGTDLIPMLNRGRDGIRELGDEAERLGILTEEQARAAGDFNDALDDLTFAVLGLGNGIGGGLLGPLTDLINRLTALVVASKPEIIARLTQAMGDFQQSLPGIIKGLQDLLGFLGTLARVLGPMIQAVGGFGEVLNLLALVMIGRVAIAIWLAVKAVWALNTAMYANPVGLVIIGIALLVAAIFLLIRRWRLIAQVFTEVWTLIRAKWAEAHAFFERVFERVSAAFQKGVAGIWNKLPQWFRTLVTGGAFLVRTAINATRPGDPPAGGGGDRPRPRAPGGGGSPAQADVNGRIDIRVSQDGRVGQVRATSRTPGLSLAPAGGAPVRGVDRR